MYVIMAQAMQARGEDLSTRGAYNIIPRSEPCDFYERKEGEENDGREGW